MRARRAPFGSVSVLMQVALLAVFAVLASQIVAFAVVLTAPPPRPAGFSVAAAADALSGKPAETSDGRALKRRFASAPPSDDRPVGPIERAIAGGLAQRLGRPLSEVRVRLRDPMPRVMALGQGPGQRNPMLGREVGVTTSATQTFVFRNNAPADGQPDGPSETQAAARAAAMRQIEALLLERTGPRDDGAATTPDVRVVTSGDRQTRFSITADSVTFAPFSAWVRMADGRWAMVEPPRGLIDPWQAKLLMALGITALLLAPLVWLMARHLTRPIRQFAEAAERLGANPDADPLTPSGPTEVRTAIGAFNDMQGSIRDHMRQRTQTIAAIAHDLRTPLTRLRFRAEQAPEALRDKMAADVEEMDALIGQAMSFVRGEEPTERRELLDLHLLTMECAEDFADTGAAVTFEGQTALPVQGDPAAFRRAVSNLIENAVKFAGAARVMTQREGAHAVIWVHDDGPGVADSELEIVFEPFQRGERSRNRQTGGAGLGLAVARQAVRASGGDVTLTNRPGGGLTARLELPIRD